LADARQLFIIFSASLSAFFRRLDDKMDLFHHFRIKRVIIGKISNQKGRESNVSMESFQKFSLHVNDGRQACFN
jgi:hypothetical protein